MLQAGSEVVAEFWRGTACWLRCTGRKSRESRSAGLSSAGASGAHQRHRQLHTIVSKDGTVQSLELIFGHPLLVQSAIDAVKQWRYRPTLLNGEPVEVATEIDVIFALSS